MGVLVVETAVLNANTPRNSRKNVSVEAAFTDATTIVPGDSSVGSAAPGTDLYQGNGPANSAAEGTTQSDGLVSKGPWTVEDKSSET
jgi:hypothetical protein